MSINDFLNKIKSKTGIDKVTIVYLLIIVGVGISSFGLGRISLNNSLNENSDSDMIMTETENEKESANWRTDIKNNEISSTQPTQFMEKRYVASKNGKMYYSLGCSGAKRINPENEVWFSTREDAEKSGYALSSACK